MRISPSLNRIENPGQRRTRPRRRTGKARAAASSAFPRRLTEARRATLRAEGCDAVQGYLFSRPVPVPQAGAVIARWNGPARAIA